MYNPKEIEKKWQDFWKKNKIFKTENDFSKPKWYSLDMFPYPSGAGLHVGHPEGFTANDIIARYKHAKGFNVLHPMGWDAFGLPAENYAIKTGTHPRTTTDNNIKVFKSQLQKIGFSYDWDREVDTTDPNYYKWTQWIFLKLFENGLAYEQDLPINYCPSCKTGLANEEVLNDFTCERCGTKVEKKKIKQWVLAITKYADRLLKDVDNLDWPESIKDMQRNWIGKSEGCEFEMKKWTEKKGELSNSHEIKHNVQDFFSSKNTTIKKGELPLSVNGGGHNGLAKFSLTSIIFKNIEKVKKKINFLGKIDGKVKLDNATINFNSDNILSHFRKKHFKEFTNRSKLLATVFVNIGNLIFVNEFEGYFAYKKNIIKVILGKQKNGNYFVKSYYKYEKFTNLYKKYLKEQANIPKISVYTTRIDTVFGMTYAVLAPDHKNIWDFITPEQKEICEKYIEDSAKKSDQDRTQDDKEKTGVFTGSYVINPFNNEKVPLWIGDYVLGNYGTGAVMAVPAHDERDFEFAKKYGLEIKQSIAKLIKGGGIDAVRENKETIKRNNVQGILLNKNNEIFVLDWEKFGWKSFVIGGIKDGETKEEAILREVKEETGYQNIKIIRELGGEIHSSFFASHKNVNRYAISNSFLIELVDDTYIEPNKEDVKNHKGFWLFKDKIKQFINLENHIMIWNIYENGEKAFTDYGILVNSEKFSGLTSEEAKIKLTEFATKNGFGKKKINYKLRDWLFSRQRYWGEPIPLIHIKNEDLEKLPKLDEKEISQKIEKIINKKMKIAITQIKGNKSSLGNIKNANKKMRNAPLQAEWGFPMETTAKISLSDIIIKKIKKVKKKRKKSFFLKEYLEIKTIGTKKIQISGQYLKEHFRKKSDKEFFKRIKMSSVILENLEKVFFLNDTFGIMNLHNRFWIIILEKNTSNTYNLVTFYEFYELSKYIKNISHKAHKLGKNHIFLNGEKLKIYDGLYSKIICDYNLPLKLPQVENYEPAGDGNSPLKNVENFVNVKLAENLSGERETNTMPQWGGSCWYYLRFMDPKNNDKLVNPEIEKYRGQVDSYVGGAEHAVLHLLYARFWHKFLFDIGVVSHNEPFYRLRNQGLILAHAFQRKNGGLLANDLVEEKDGKYYEIETGEEVNRIISKMSKSLKNVINPDDIIKEYGADSLRLYEMYMADFKDAAPWDTKGIIGVRRFLDKSERLFKTPLPTSPLTGERSNENPKISNEDDDFTMKLLHKTIKKIEEDIENFKFNTAIAALMILVNNGLPKDEKLQAEWKSIFVRILHPFAPHLAEELFERIENGELRTEKKSIFFEAWPEFDENLVKDDEITIGVQVMGKLRGEIKIGVDEEQNSVLEKAKNCESVKKWIDGKNIVKEIYVKGKIVNLVVK